MTEVKVELPDELAAEIARRAAALGTTPEEWVAAVVQDIAADLPEDAGDGPDDFIAR
jgi:transglutaminase-like putative cysteine protease